MKDVCSFRAIYYSIIPREFWVDFVRELCDVFHTGNQDMSIRDDEYTIVLFAPYETDRAQ